MERSIVRTEQAPRAIGSYSQAVGVGRMVFVSGQIPLDPTTMQVVEGDAETSIRRIFANLRAVCEGAGGRLEDIVKLTVYLIDLADFPVVNRVMGEIFPEPYPARAAVGVAALPLGARAEIDAILILPE